MNTKIIIIGGRGTAIVIADQICDAHDRFGSKLEVLGLALDDRSMGDDINGYPILCGIKELYDKYGQQEDVQFIYSLYRSDVIAERTKILKDLNIPLEKFINFVHPSVMLSKSAKMGYGNVILANCVVNANFEFGNFNTVNSGTLLGHDTKIGNNNFIAGHVCVGSGLNIGNQNFIGLNSSLKNLITMGDRNLIGMASNLTKDVECDSILFGNPAILKRKRTQ